MDFSDFKLREAIPQDLAALHLLSEECFGANAWSLPLLEAVLESRVHLVLVAEVESPQTAQNGAEGYEIAGLIITQVVLDEAEVQSLAVPHSKRRHGIGSRLLTEALGRCLAQGARTTYLDVRESNLGAQEFYRRHGFEVTGLRKGYYPTPPDNALLMSRTL